MPAKHQPDLESWFLNHVESVLRTQPTGSKTAACVDESFLDSFARSASNLSLADPRVEHVTSCSFCIRRFLEIRKEQREFQQRRPAMVRRKPWVLVAAAAAVCLIVVLTCAILFREMSHGSQAQQQIVTVQRTVDLSDYGTYRGGDQPRRLPPVSLPAAVVNLQLILPRLSDPGKYTLAIFVNENSTDAVARVGGLATGADPRTVLAVTLDLRAAKPGMYVLSTEREGDGGPYYYPLRIE